ncbi:MAG: methyltransferase domain-containing protein [Candidatus Latescibacteria bacterium]|nr:methyltransferase domain-containing protein [Candidatus Latescibacterota bacterium]
MAKKKKSDKATQRQAFGLTVLKAADNRIRRLKKDHDPEIHGNKFWNSSWLLMDYLMYQGMPFNTRIMEVGCGWGLAGMFCAKHFGARVTGVDADPAVFPYLQVHAQINGVEMATKKARFEELKKKKLAKYDIILGADICFWDEMVDPLYTMIRKAVKAGVQQIIVADPGRPPFVEVCERAIAELGGVTQAWSVEEPVRAEGELLIVGALPQEKK